MKKKFFYFIRAMQIGACFVCVFVQPLSLQKGPVRQVRVTCEEILQATFDENEKRNKNKAE